MEDYDDERVRLIFSRLQRGKPLALGERLNAEPGTIVECMRELAHHPFMSKSIGVAKIVMEFILTQHEFSFMKNSELSSVL